MTRSLRTRLALSHMLVAALSVLLASALANGLLESVFRRYVREGQEREARLVAERLAGRRAADGSWDPEGLAVVGMEALDRGMVVKLLDPSGSVVWDAAVHNSGLCVQMIDALSRGMAARYPSWRASYAEARYPVRIGSRELGTAVIGTYGPFYLGVSDLAFLDSLNRLLLAAAAAALALAAGVGFFLARRISVPLVRAAEATGRIAAGDRAVRVEEGSGAREIDGIAAAVNGLSAALVRQEALRQRLTADVAHELRTPLATLQSHLEALIDGVWEPDPQRLSGLHAEVLRLNRLVADLENLARMEEGAPDLARTDLDLGALAGDLVSLHEPSFRAAGVRLELEKAAAAVPVLADADRLTQAVVNLLSNARKHTPAGGAVTVSVGMEGRDAWLRVADTGRGIPEADLPFVFERLYRADPSRARSTGGSGIGLSIAKAIVEAHGGRIHAEGGEGRGAAFTIRLPRGDG